MLSLALCAGLLAGCGTGETAEAPSDTDVQQVDSLKIAFSPYADADLISESTEPLEELLKAKLLEKGYDVGEIDMTVGTSYTAVGEALSAGSADLGFISGGNYVLFSDDCDVLLTALRPILAIGFPSADVVASGCVTVKFDFHPGLGFKSGDALFG